MKNFINRRIKLIIKFIFSFFLKFDTFAKILTLISSLDKYEKKEIFGKKIYLIQKNYITKYRNDTILSKEPETIEWIQEMHKESVFCDVGSNIGLYSITAALLNSKKVIAFEPSFFNLQLLSKNIFINNLSEKILIVPISLDSKIGHGLFNLGSTEEGGALSTFENSKSDNSSILRDDNFTNKNYIFNYTTISFTLDEFFKHFKHLNPDYLKIDVDGIETKILKGGTEVLKNVKSVLVESNSIADEKEIINIMNFFDLNLIKKNENSFNLIFKKDLV